MEKRRKAEDKRARRTQRKEAGPMVIPVAQDDVEDGDESTDTDAPSSDT